MWVSAIQALSRPRQDVGCYGLYTAYKYLGGTDYLTAHAAGFQEASIRAAT